MIILFSIVVLFDDDDELEVDVENRPNFVTWLPVILTPRLWSSVCIAQAEYDNSRLTRECLTLDKHFEC